VFSIVISEKGGAERRESFEQDEVTIGRVQGNDLMLPKGNVSKRHCRVIRQNGRFLVADEESTNGTYVNRRRIAQATAVREGDRIYVGDFILRIESDEAKGSVSPVPAPEARHEPPARPPMATTPEIDIGPPLSASSPAAAPPPIPAAVASVTPSRSGPEPSSRSARDSDGGDLGRLSTLGLILAKRVAAAVESRLLERPDATLERRLERLVDDAFNELVIEGDVATGSDEVRVKAAVVSELVGLGPLGPLLADESVQEIAVTGAGHIAVQRAGRRSTRELPFFLAESVPRVAARLCRQAGIEVEPSAALFRTALPKLGFDMTLLGPSVVTGTATLGLIRRESVSTSLDDLVRAGTVSRTMATFLRHCLMARINLVVVGPTRSGADEVLSALVNALEGERVLGLAPTEGPAKEYESVVWLNAAPSTASDVLRSVATLPDHRLLVDGLTGARALAVLAAIAEGAQGVLVRVNARSIERGLARLCSEMSLERPGVTPFVAAEWLVSAFDLALEVARLPDGRSRVLRISELERGEESLLGGTDVFDFAVERTATGGSIEGTFRNIGHSPQLVAELRAKGINIDPASFSRPPSADDRRVS
jgi:pilus assembly protein CpaF